ncbi:MAG: MATE family efflux transporter, partial [Gemmatimonadetes bacterium]|nr:MATE family efflux transporter [Gemmatimonadota bacterium]
MGGAYAAARFKPTPTDLKSLAALAFPVAVVQVGLVFQGVVDTLMVGRVSPSDLAAVALGNLYFFAVSVFGMGVLFALDPLVSQAFGAEEHDEIELGVQRGLILAGALALVASLALSLAEPVLTALRQPEDVIPRAAGYAVALIPGMIPFYAFVVFRQSLQAVGKVAPVVVTIIAANLVNAGANWLLIFGNGGAPAMGVVGSGWATSVSRWFMALAVLGLGWRTIGRYVRRFRREVLQPAPYVPLVRVGVPIGGHFVLEFGAFGAIGVVMGWLGTVAMAGHQVAINLASLTFMVPVGLAQASAVLVGQSVGSGQAAAAQRYAGAAVILCVLVMTVSAAVFLLFP